MLQVEAEAPRTTATSDSGRDCPFKMCTCTCPEGVYERADSATNRVAAIITVVVIVMVIIVFAAEALGR